MTELTTETFFLPDEIDREASRIPGDIYNLIRHLQTCSESGCVFVPIRSLQVFGILTEHEVAFVDSLLYTHVDDEGGRVILLGWNFTHTQNRDALDTPVDCDVIYYREEGRTLQSRLIVEFRSALLAADRLLREEAMPAEGARIIRLGNTRD